MAELNEMLKEGIAKPATTELASPILFSSRMDGTLKFCVDHCCLNAMSIRESYTISRVGEYIDSQEHARVFSTLKANAGRWQVETDERNQNKTAFVTHHGLCRY